MVKFKGISKVINSYQKAPEHLKKNAEQWAAAGFFYTGKKAIVKCHSCDAIHNVRDDGRNPWELHLVNSPDCLFVTLIEKYTRPSFSAVAAEKKSDAESYTQPDSNAGAAEKKDEAIVPYRDLLSIVASYDSAPAILRKRLPRFALAGFFYTGQNDLVECFCCGESISNWDVKLDPFVQHVEQRPECKYVQLVLKHDLIDAAGSQNFYTKIKSFEISEDYVKNRAISFASAGFHYIEWTNGIHCRNCNLTLFGISGNFDAFSKHSLSSPNCKYVVCVNNCNSFRISNNQDFLKNIHSFDSAPELLKKQHRRIALAGLFYTGVEDMVKCNSCSLLIYHFRDGAANTHIRKRPSCEYVKAMQQHNLLEVEGQHLPTNANSFEEAPEFMKVLKIQYALAGFRYTSYFHNRNVVTCLSCCLVINNVSPDLEPWLVHKVHSPDCQYVKFVEDSGLGRILDEDLERNYEQTSNVQSMQLNADGATNGKDLCIVCMENVRDTALIPCGHAYFCSRCVNNLDQCPLCRESFIGSIIIFQP